MGNSNRNFSRNHMSLERDVVDLFVSATIGASGAVSSSQGGGLVTFVKEATAGQYTVTIDKGYSKLLGFGWSLADDADNSVATVQIKLTAAALATAVQTTGAILVQCLDFAGAAVNPTSGAQLMLHFKLRRTSYGPFD